MVAENKKEFYNGVFFENNGQPNKKIFDYVNEVKGDYEKQISNTEENPITAQELNDYFVTVGPELSSDFKNRVIFPKNIANTNSSFLSQIDEQDVCDTKKQLPNKKSEDDMGLSSYLMKKINPIITAQLTFIFNQIISEAVYPS